MAELSGGTNNGEALVEAMFGTIVTQATKDASGNVILNDVRGTDGYRGTEGQSGAFPEDRESLRVCPETSGRIT